MKKILAFCLLISSVLVILFIHRINKPVPFTQSLLTDAVYVTGSRKWALFVESNKPVIYVIPRRDDLIVGTSYKTRAEVYGPLNDLHFTNVIERAARTP